MNGVNMNGVNITQSVYQDPETINWCEITLPQTWTDDLTEKHLILGVMQLFKQAFFKQRKAVILPSDLMGSKLIPKYAQQEFHNIPNGNYSCALASGYIKGFDFFMLNKMTASRQAVAQALIKDSVSVLDIGCGGGQMSKCFIDAGIKDVWGVDISPYLLKQAALRNPKAKFIQAKGEDLPFENERFCAIGLSYVLHEVPPKYIKQMLVEINRVLKHGGCCGFIEPSEKHHFISYGKLLRQHGLGACYFRWLSHFVHEPFIKSWHKLDFTSLLKQHGFCIIKEQKNIPNNIWIAKKQRSVNLD